MTQTEQVISLLQRMLEAPGTHVRESWKDAIRPVLVALINAEAWPAMTQTIAQRLRDIAERRGIPELFKLAAELEAHPAGDPSMQRMTPGIFKGELAMFPAEDGDYVRFSDAQAAVSAALQEKDEAIASLRQQLTDLAERLEYRGNSIAFIHQKKDAYAEAIHRVFGVLGRHGFKADGATHVADLTAAALQERVPNDPTPEMLNAGAMQVAMLAQRVQTAEAGALHVWRAMRAAAPKPEPQQPQEPKA